MDSAQAKKPGESPSSCRAPQPPWGCWTLPARQSRASLWISGQDGSENTSSNRNERSPSQTLLPHPWKDPAQPHVPASLETSSEAPEWLKHPQNRRPHSSQTSCPPPLVLPLSPFSLSTSLAEDKGCKALKSTLLQKEYPDIGKVDGREGQEWMGGPRPPHPRQHTQNWSCTEATKAVKKPGDPRPPPDIDFIPPGLDSFPLYLQAPRNSPLPALAGSVRYQMPSPRTQVRVESKEDNNPQKPVLPPRAHQRFKGSDPSPKNPGQMAPSAGGGGWAMRNGPLLFGLGEQAQGPAASFPCSTL